MEIAVLSFGVVLAVLHYNLVNIIDKIVPEPYMDEIFHFNQTQEYCAGNYYTWNPKITTPPGLYVLGFLINCQKLRAVNSILIPICFYCKFDQKEMKILGLVRLRKKLITSSNTWFDAVPISLSILFLPVLLNTSWLYYTDLLSLMLVIWGFSTGIVPLSALIFAYAVFTRQTNIIWAGLYCLYNFMKIFDSERIVLSSFSFVRRYFSFVLLAFGFLVFLIKNEGIVLGDKSAHQPILHLTQLFYFSGFVVFTSLPIFLANLFSTLKTFRPSSLFLLIPILISIHFFTISHPYLLADNRHFTFYIWRKWFARHWLCKYLLAPGYLLAFAYMKKVVSSHVSKFNTLLFIAATSACLVPVHLLEPRYFIIPYVLWRLNVKEVSKKWLILELLWNISVSVLTLYLFVMRPFEWAHEPGATQRFMW